MKKFIFAAMAALAMVASSCYEDKGNYTYHDVDPIDSIKFHWNSDSRSGIQAGDTAHLIMRVVFKNPNENLADWKFVWRINNEDVAEGLEFDFMPKEIGTYYYQFYAEHKSGQRYYQDFKTAVYSWSGGYSSITVKSPYAAGGWWVLTKKDGNVSAIDVLIRSYEYIYYTDEETGDEKYYRNFKYATELDAYKIHSGEELGTNPVRMYNYFSNMNNPADMLVFQGSNNDNALYVNGMSFKKDCTLKYDFIGEQYPNGSYVSDFFWGGSANFAITNDGKVYLVIHGLNGGSSNVNGYSHISKFLSAPIDMGAGSKAEKFLGMNSGWVYSTSSAIIYDSGLNTYRLYYTHPQNGNNYHGTQRSLKVTDPTGAAVDEPDAYFASANILGDYKVIDWYFMSGPATSGDYKVMALKKHKTTGELVYDYFEFNASSSYSSAVKIKMIKENAAMPANFKEGAICAAQKVNEYFWYMDGRDVRMYNPGLDKDFFLTTVDADVTAMVVGPGWSDYQKQQLVLGTADKKITMYNIGLEVIQFAATNGDAKNYPDDGKGDRFIYWQNATSGVPVDIKHRKISFSNSVFDQFG